MTEIRFVIQFIRFNSSPVLLRLGTGIHLIYGESGVGKSALCRRLALSKNELKPHNFTLSRISGYSSPMMVFQDPDVQIVAPTVGRELAFNLENLGWNFTKIQRRISKLESTFSLSFSKDRNPATLSGGERELLNIVTAISTSPDLLLIDDGMSFLSGKTKSRCIDLLRKWTKEKHSVVLWFTSDPDDLGKSESRWQLSLDSLTRIEEPFEKKYNTVQKNTGEMLMRLKGLSFSYPESEPLFDELSLEVGPFRSLAVLGENGSGKSTFGALVSGVEQPLSGSIELSMGNNQSMIAALPQSPERLFEGFTPSELAKMMMAENRASENFLKEVIDAVGYFQIAWERVCDVPVHELSLSEARLVLISLLCQANYDLLIFDEPMFSLGIAQRQKLMESLQNVLRHKYLILITHDEKEADALCDMLLRIHEGELSISSIQSYA
ncbi:MAG: hypothetical protein CMG71_06570 [Candidatus Marinimicrobia bacterium]|nr:hypothetical protein [Candidatus Neomarinimicrobiota bacterium]